jgi:hypothetical protein
VVWVVVLLLLEYILRSACIQWWWQQQQQQVAAVDAVMSAIGWSATSWQGLPICHCVYVTAFDPDCYTGSDSAKA